MLVEDCGTFTVPPGKRKDGYGSLIVVISIRILAVESFYRGSDLEVPNSRMRQPRESQGASRDQRKTGKRC